jgi:hypothetical protein
VGSSVAVDLPTNESGDVLSRGVASADLQGVAEDSSTLLVTGGAALSGSVSDSTSDSDSEDILYRESGLLVNSSGSIVKGIEFRGFRGNGVTVVAPHVVLESVRVVENGGHGIYVAVRPPPHPQC